VVAKDRAASRFLGYLDEVGVDDLAALDVRDVSASCCANVDYDARPSRP